MTTLGHSSNRGPFHEKHPSRWRVRARLRHDRSASPLSFFADVLNRQGANPANTPGALLETVSGHAVSDPDSFSGSRLAAFDASAPFSMTEGAALALRSDGSVTGFSQSMQTGVPEPSTWAMLIIGFIGLAWAGLRRGKSARYAL
jgi:hypothetical protein